MIVFHKGYTPSISYKGFKRRASRRVILGVRFDLPMCYIGKINLVMTPIQINSIMRYCRSIIKIRQIRYYQRSTADPRF